MWAWVQFQTDARVYIFFTLAAWCPIFPPSSLFSQLLNPNHRWKYICAQVSFYTSNLCVSAWEMWYNPWKAATILRPAVEYSNLCFSLLYTGIIHFNNHHGTILVDWRKRKKKTNRVIPIRNKCPTSSHLNTIPMATKLNVNQQFFFFKSTYSV